MSSSRNLLALKAATQSKAIEEKQNGDRQRDSLILIQSHLLQLGYIQTAAQLQKEAGANLSRYERADNIDLMQVISEYEEFYELKFNRKPKLSRRISESTASTSSNGQEHQHGLKRGSRPTATSARTNKRSSSHTILKPIDTSICHARNNDASSKRLLPSIIGNASKQKCVGTKHDKTSETKNEISIQGDELDHENAQNIEESGNTCESSNDRMIKPLPSFGDDFQLRALASSIQREIIDTSPKVQWNEIIELDNAKQLLKEAVVIPLQYPELFTGLLSPWSGILLYGAPGTGKVSTYWTK